MLLKRLKSQMPVSNIFCIYAFLQTCWLIWWNRCWWLAYSQSFENAIQESLHTSYSFSYFKTNFCYLYTYRQRICNNCSGEGCGIPSQNDKVWQRSEWQSMTKSVLIGWRRNGQYYGPRKFLCVFCILYSDVDYDLTKVSMICSCSSNDNQVIKVSCHL